ncbi:MAG: alkyl/aryl-sulfatase [Fusobacteriaceae bacterium]
MKNSLKIRVGTLIIALSMLSNAEEVRKDATKFTKQENEKIKEILNFEDKRDFEDASRGFIATWPNNKIIDKDGKVVWDFDAFKFVGKDTNAPDTVNPSLWRQAKINNIHGLFEVTKGIYQVRGFDLANITFMRGDKGWVVIDVCTSGEIAEAAYKLLKENVEDLPITGVVFTHSHVDHFGGILGIVSEKDVKEGKVKVLAPAHFFKEAISENIMVGNAMGRRASFMYGSLLPRDEKGTVDAGLGKAVSIGSVGVLEPSDSITTTGEKAKIDGIDMEFIMASGTEAPSEFMFYIPKYKAFCPAEVVNATLHNISTLRGAKTRDALAWANAIDEAYVAVGNKAEVMMAPHHWPTFGNARIKEKLTKQRDMYKYLHDQSIRMANAGYNPVEIAEEIVIPKTLETEFYNRGYYGTVNHDVKAVYDFYFGAWWDGTPANLYKLPPVEAGKRYVKSMGGEKKVIEMAKKAYTSGDYRWVVELLNHVVLSNPKNQEARNLEADAMEQLGYQAESAPWRSYLLSGAQELRKGVAPMGVPKPLSEGMLKVLPLKEFLNYLSVIVNPQKAEGVTEILNLEVTDTKENYSVELSNSSLKVREMKDANPTVTLKISREKINDIILKKTTLAKEVESGNAKVDKMDNLKKIAGTLEEPKFWFNLVESNSEHSKAAKTK